MRVLVVDGEPVQLETLCRGLFLCGHQGCPARSAAEARDLLAAGDFDLLLTDESDLARLDALRRLAPGVPILITTAMTGAPMAGPVLAKPFTPDELDAAVRKACRCGCA